MKTVGTYIGSFVVEQVMVISNKPSLLPVRADTATPMFVEPAFLSRIGERIGRRSFISLKGIARTSIYCINSGYDA